MKQAPEELEMKAPAMSRVAVTQLFQSLPHPQGRERRASWPPSLIDS
jgi:hypothetical protein